MGIKSGFIGFLMLTSSLAFGEVEFSSDPVILAPEKPQVVQIPAPGMSKVLHLQGLKHGHFYHFGAESLGSGNLEVYINNGKGEIFEKVNPLDVGELNPSVTFRAFNLPEAYIVLRYLGVEVDPIKVTLTPIVTEEVHVGQTQDSQLVKKAKVLSVQVEEGQSLNIAVTSEIDTMIEVLDPENNLVAEADDDVLTGSTDPNVRVFSRTTGTYIILVHGLEDGSFSIDIEEVSF